MKSKKLYKKILQAVYNSKRYDDFGRKEVNEQILAKAILKIFIQTKNIKIKCKFQK